MADLWEFGDVEDLKPLEDSSEEEDNKAQYDELSCLPPHKRRKIQKLNAANQQFEWIDLDNEENTCNKPAHQGKKPSKQSVAFASDSDLDLEYIPTAKRAREAPPLDPILVQNAALLRCFKEAAQEPEIDDLTTEPEAPQSQKLSSPAQPAANRSQGGASDHDPDSDAASESDCDEEPEEDTRVVLKLQCSKGVLNLRTRTQGAMSNLFAAFKAQAKSKGWIQDVQMPMKFVFEGDPLTGKETAESLDLEGDEILEVRW